jgi:hypothetical protein
VYHRAGRTQDALVDLELAVTLFEQQRELALKAAEDESQAVQERIKRDLNHNLAVLLHHRGLAHEANCDGDAAKSDKERAKELGYNEEKGIF